jgi:ATP-dependent DNA helicase RecG
MRIGSVPTTYRVGDRVGDKEGVILNLLREDPAYTYAKLSVKTGLSEKTIFVKMKVLKEKGLIERVGNAKKGYWKIV